MEWSLMARESIVFYPMQYILTVDIIFDNLFFTEKTDQEGVVHRTYWCVHCKPNKPVIFIVNTLVMYVLYMKCL